MFIYIKLFSKITVPITFSIMEEFLNPYIHQCQISKLSFSFKLSLIGLEDREANCSPFNLHLFDT